MKLDNRRNRLFKIVDRYVGIPLVLFLAGLKPLRKLFAAKSRGAPQKILVSKLSALGDAVLLLPALCHLKKNFPQAQIVFLGGSSNKDFVKLLPAISRFESFSIKNVLRLCFEPFDLFVDFDQWSRVTSVAAGLSRAGKTFGFRSQKQWRHYAYNGVVDLNFKTHMAVNFWNLCSLACGAFASSASGDFESDKLEAKTLWAQQMIRQDSLKNVNLAPQGTYVVIHPGCGEHGKFREWPLDSWAELIKIYAVEEPNIKVYVTGHGAYEETMGQALEAHGAISTVNKLSLGQTMKFLSEAREVYAPNTGIMHLASLFNDNVTVLNGPTDSRLWGPLWRGKIMTSPVACAPCLTWGHDYGCSDPVCLKVIKAKQVFKASYA